MPGERRLLAALVVVFGFVMTCCLHTETAHAGTLYLKACSGFGDSATALDITGPVWQSLGPAELSEANRCAQGGSLQIIPDSRGPFGANAQWHTITPPSIGIVGAFTPANDVLVEPPDLSSGYQASYFWDGGIQSIPAEGTCCGGMDYGLGINRTDLNGSRYFGFQVSCQQSPDCEVPQHQLLDVKGIQLTAVDNTPPAVSPDASNDIWTAHGWLRGVWPGSFTATDASGVCDMTATVGGTPIQGPTATPNQSSWTQCPSPATMKFSVDTARQAEGPLSLTLSASDAAAPANVSSSSETVSVDNNPVSVQLTGPEDAPSNSGTQYVRAQATAGPSGVKDIQCSVDNAPFTSYPGAAAAIPVSGVGEHIVDCFAENNAIDASGDVAKSPIGSWTLSIRQPTVSEITFGTRIANAMRCRSVIERTRVQGRWVVVRVQGERVRVHLHAVTHVRHVVHCRARVVTRTVSVDGRRIRRRVVLLPHRVQVSVKRVGFRGSATVDGWLGLSDGAALPHTPVTVLTAVDNGQNRWRPAETVLTNSAGLWQARLPPGPSRLVTASYAGSATAEPTVGDLVQLISQTRITLDVRPTVTGWGQTISIAGRVLGGDIPAGKLLRLRIGAEGIHATVGIPSTSRTGRYRTTWTFAPGHGTIRYWFSVSTLAEADYPYAPTSSPRAYVTVRG